MSNKTRNLSALAIAVIGIMYNSSGSAAGASGIIGKTPVTPEQCLAVNYFTHGIGGNISLNPQGSRVAYLVDAPEIATKAKRVRLFTRAADKIGTPQMIAEETDIASVKWSDDGRHLTALVPRMGRRAIVSMDSATGVKQVLLQLNEEDIDEYSVDSNEDEIVVKSRSGKIFLSRKSPAGTFGKPDLLDFPLPEKFIPMDGGLLQPSISPDGKKISVNFGIRLSDVPEEWLKDPRVRAWRAIGYGGVTTTVVKDLSSGKIQVIPLINAGAPASWSRDSSGFVVTGASPVNSDWALRDFDAKYYGGGQGHFFWVNADTGSVEKVMDRNFDDHDAPLFWKNSGEVLLRASSKSLGWFRRAGATWRKVSEYKMPEEAYKYSYRSLASNGKAVVGDFELPNSPPRLVQFNIGSPRQTVLDDINPAMAKVVLSKPDLVHWTMPLPGGRVRDFYGLLFKPLDYRLGQRYPLIIQTKGSGGWFVCDDGSSHYPGSIPQLAAGAGMMYLVRYDAPETSTNLIEETTQFSAEYPGNIGEAVGQMRMWEAAVDSLSAAGLVDAARVGITGFSRTGWYVEFALAHSKLRYASATVGDNIQYSLSENWVLDRKNVRDAASKMYGGPPFGKSLQNWLKYSISFNLDKIHTPLLLETHGYGIKEDPTGYTVPISILVRNEVLYGLKQLERPVDAYYYYRTDHTLTDPGERVLSMQRQLDWFRFWLQGYVDPDPAKVDQYQRWKQLREQHDADLRTVENE